MLILPAIDLRYGKCVRLTQGDFERESIYSDDPKTVAEEFVGDGAEWIHLVDLDGARAGKPLQWQVAQSIAQSQPVHVQLGGGFREAQDVEIALNSGIQRIVLGSRLISDRQEVEQIFKIFGGKVAAALDCRDGKVAIGGWIEDSGLDIVELAKDLEFLGAERLIVTDIKTDGMMCGPNLTLLDSVGQAVSLPIIASGGISNLEDLKNLKRTGRIEGAIVGRALYEKRFSLSEAIQAVQ
jgi:phosphoribosylformimino-5-aminoimidazole carboxamide ribotide isomerase